MIAVGDPPPPGRRSAVEIGVVTTRQLRVLVAAIALLAAVAVPGPAAAFSQAAYPAVSLGNRGEDVRSLQYLLRHHGYSTPVNGGFGTATDQAVRHFQSDRGLVVDGIVGPQTWGAAVVTLARGSQGPPVMAVQRQMNAKFRAGLKLNARFDAATERAVIEFQEHAAIPMTGVVDSVTWTNLLWHYQQVPIRADANTCAWGPTDRQWGTAETTAQIVVAAVGFASTGNGKVAMGDVSWEHGGPLSGHVSHQVGMDADINPIRVDSAQCTSGTRWDSSTYDQAGTRALIRALYAAAPGKIKVIWFNDPQLISEGLTQYLDGHDDHLHVRWCVDYYPSTVNYRCTSSVTTLGD